MLGASLAIKVYRDPVSSLEDLLVSDMKLVISANSSIQDYFSDDLPSGTAGNYILKVNVIWLTCKVTV